MNDGTHNIGSLAFYIWGILYLVTITGLIVATTKRKKNSLLKNFIVYFAFFLFDIIGCDIYQLFFNKLNFRYDEYIDYLFTLVELLIFSIFFYNILNNTILKKLIQVITLAFILFAIVSILTNKYFYYAISQQARNRIYTIEAIVLIFYCVFYYIGLFKKSIYPDLINEPSFWIVTGISFFMICTLPYSLMEIYLLKNFKLIGYQLYSIFYVFYILLFIMIIKGFYCKPNLAK